MVWGGNDVHGPLSLFQGLTRRSEGARQPSSSEADAFLSVLDLRGGREAAFAWTAHKSGNARRSTSDRAGDDASTNGT